MKRSRGIRAAIRPSQEPHACVILAVDTAQVSGWCISLRGIYISSGQFDMLRLPDQAKLVCESAVELGRANKLPVVLVYEQPFAGTKQGAYIGAWRMAWAAAGAVKSRTKHVYPSTWRSRVLGKGWGSAERDRVRAREQEVAALVVGRAVGEDEAPAVLIAKWATHAGEVAKKLPEGARKAVA